MERGNLEVQVWVMGARGKREEPGRVRLVRMLVSHALIPSRQQLSCPASFSFPLHTPLPPLPLFSPPPGFAAHVCSAGTSFDMVEVGRCADELGRCWGLEA